MDPQQISNTILASTAGIFFAISGYHKVFHAERRASLKATLDADFGFLPERMRGPFVRFNVWNVAVTELLAGAALALGFAPLISAGLLLIICLVACFVDGAKRVAEWKPINKADALDTWLYLPETLYAIILAVVIVVNL